MDPDFPIVQKSLFRKKLRQDTPISDMNVISRAVSSWPTNQNQDLGSPFLLPVAHVVIGMCEYASLLVLGCLGACFDSN